MWWLNNWVNTLKTNGMYTLRVNFMAWELCVNKAVILKQEGKKGILETILHGNSSGPVIRTPCFHRRGHGFDPWWGNLDPTCHRHGQKKKERNYTCCVHLCKINTGSINQELKIFVNYSVWAWTSGKKREVGLE